MKTKNRTFWVVDYEGGAYEAWKAASNYSCNVIKAGTIYIVRNSFDHVIAWEVRVLD